MKKFIRFLLAGLPAFAVGVPLNYALVTWAALGKPMAYAVVLIVQVTINFFACASFVFQTHPEANLWKRFWLFFSGILAFRAADWAIYVAVITHVDVHYLIVQVCNVAIFSVLKFWFSRQVFETGRCPEKKAELDS